MSHVLHHIFTNALQAMRDIGDKEIILSLIREKDLARIRIRDNGEGIVKQNLDRIFGHGYTTRPQAHGFGLHSCAKAMTEVGGRIHAESSGPGDGATFILELPVFPEKHLEKSR